MNKLKEEELLIMLGMAVQNAIEYFVINKDKEFIEKIPKLQQAHLQIKERLQQSVPIKLYEDFEFDSVLDKILERVARDLHYGTEDAMIDVKKLFRSLVQKPVKKPTVPKAFAEKWAEKIIPGTIHVARSSHIKEIREKLKQALKEAGVETEEK